MEELKKLLDLVNEYPRLKVITLGSISIEMAEGVIKSEEPKFVMMEPKAPELTEDEMLLYSTPHFDEIVAEKNIE